MGGHNQRSRPSYLVEVKNLNVEAVGGRDRMLLPLLNLQTSTLSLANIEHHFYMIVQGRSVCLVTVTDRELRFAGKYLFCRVRAQLTFRPDRCQLKPSAVASVVIHLGNC